MNNEKRFRESFSEEVVHTFKDRLVANVLALSVLLGLAYNASKVEPRILPEESKLSILEDEALVSESNSLGRGISLSRKRVNKRARESKMDIATL